MKEELRKKYLEIRKNINDKDKKSHIITNKIIDLLDYQQAKIIALYYNLPNEVSTELLIHYSLKNNKIVALPRVYHNTLKFYKIATDEQYEISKYKIKEPIAIEENYIAKDIIDLIIVPGVCFDINGNRIGYGKGYYDNYLTYEMNTIGICFKEQLTNYILNEKHDKKMKLIITD